MKTKFVDRKKSLDFLINQWQEALENGGLILFIEGETGIGKTVLLKEFIKIISTSQEESYIAYGTGEEYRSTEGYYIFLDAFQNIFSSEFDIKKLKKIADIFYECAPSIISAIPIMGSIPSAIIDVIQKARKKFKTKFEQFELPHSAISQQFGYLMKKLTKKFPMLLVLDDIHWSDESSVGVVNYISQICSDLPLLMICAYRLDDAIISRHPILDAKAELLHKNKCIVYNIPPMRRTETKHLVNSILGKHKLQTDFFDLLYNQTLGNPLFVEQILSELIENKIINTKDKYWLLTSKIDTIEIPSNLKQVFEERIRRLNDEIKNTLIYASAEGTRFTSKILSIILESNELSIISRLRIAQESYRLIKYDCEIGYSKNKFTNLYEFSHPFFHKSFYEKLSTTEKIFLHKTIAKSIEDIWKDDLDEVYEELARHFLNGQEYNKAIHYSILAGEKNQNRSAYKEALKLYNKALKILDSKYLTISSEKKSNLKAKLYLNIGIAEYLMSNWENSKKALNFSITLAKTTLNDIILIKSLIELGKLYHDLGELDDSINYLLKALSLAQEKDEKNSIINSLLYLAQSQRNKGMLSTALQNYRLARDYYNKFGFDSDYLKALIHHGLALTLQRQGALNDSSITIKVAIKLFRNNSNLNNLVQSLELSSAINHSLGKIFSGWKDLNEALSIAKKINLKFWINELLGAKALILLDLELPEKAEIFCKELYKSAEDCGDMLHLAFANEIKGTILLKTNKTNYIIKYLEYAKNFYKADKWEELYSRVLVKEALYFLKISDLTKAKSYIGKSLNISKQIKAIPIEAFCLFALGLFHFQIKKYKDATNFYEQSIEKYIKIGAIIGRLEVLDNYCDCCIKIGQNEKAIELINDQISIIKSLELKRNKDFLGFKKNKLSYLNIKKRQII